MSDQMKREFEEWYLSQIDNDAPVLDGGVFSSQHSKWCWQAWQASRKALVVELPQPEKSYFGALPYEKGMVDGINAMLDDCQAALDKAGVQYK
jgi:hypothetical protein